MGVTLILAGVLKTKPGVCAKILVDQHSPTELPASTEPFFICAVHMVGPGYMWLT